MIKSERADRVSIVPFYLVKSRTCHAEWKGPIALMKEPDRSFKTRLSEKRQDCTMSYRYD